MRDFRIDDHRGTTDRNCAAGAGSSLKERLDHPACDGALEIVRHQPRLRIAGKTRDMSDDGALDVAVGVGIALVVDPRHLLVALGDHAHFLGRRPPVVFHQTVGLDSRRAQQLPKARRSGVVPDHRHQARPSTQRDDVVRHVGSAAQPHVLRFEPDDRHRRFRRNSCDASDNEAIEHRVADDEHGKPREAPDQVARASGVNRRQRHQEGGRTAAAGRVTIVRNSISTSESPKLYSNRPAVRRATIAAIAVAASSRCPE